MLADWQLAVNGEAAFQAVRVVAGSVEWPGELDLSYGTLCLESRPIAAAPAMTREASHGYPGVGFRR